MPVFCWTSLASNLLIIAAFPVLTVTLGLLMLDRYLGFHFFTNDGGGNSMLYMNLIWIWGHPEVYILILPAFGIFSEVVATFSGKPLFGYRSMVFATLAICIISFMVWLHHFFTMGAGANINAIFGIASMLIAIPTGVKIYNWLFTMYGGRVRFTVPMHYTDRLHAHLRDGRPDRRPAGDPAGRFHRPQQLFLVAHFHHVIIGGVVFGVMAGYTYWFPKAFGFTLHEGLGKAIFWCWFIGFHLAFMPLYVLGFWGGTRRMQHIPDPTWAPWLNVAMLGAVVIGVGIVLTVVQLFYSIKTRDQRLRRHRRSLGRPHARMADSIAAAALQFRSASRRPRRGGLLDAQADGDQAGPLIDEPDYKPIEMPLNTPTGRHLRLLRHGLRLRDHLAHLVARDPRPDRRLRHLRLVRVARRA